MSGKQRKLPNICELDRREIVTVAADYTMEDDDYNLFVDVDSGTVNVTLPDCWNNKLRILTMQYDVEAGGTFNLKDQWGNTLKTVNTAQDGVVAVQSFGFKWVVIDTA